MGKTISRKLKRYDIPVIENAITSLEHENGFLKAVHFDGVPSIFPSAILIHPPCTMASDLPDKLGCATTKSGKQIKIDRQGRTSVKGVYAAGDIVTGLSHIVTAAASGAAAGMAINHDLLKEEYK